MTSKVHATPGVANPTAFLKMHGNGNDVVIVFADAGQAMPNAERIRALAERHTGIGFDQLIWVTPSDAEDTDARYRICNADGGEVEQCGNGARCVARAWHDRHGSTGTLTFESPAGPIAAQVDGAFVTLDMGPPRRPAADLPPEADSDRPLAKIEAIGRTWPLWLVSMGNPHAVLVTDDVRTAPVAELGRALQRHAAFPQGVNVGFLQPESGAAGRLRVFERGAGETAACGSGASAAHVAGVLAGVFDADTTLTLPGGDLMVSWRGPGQAVWLRGPAEYVYNGTIDL